MPDQIIASPLNSNSANLHRLTFSGQVYHQRSGDDIHSVPLQYQEFLLVDEQSYQRSLKASEAWQNLDFGWLQPEQVGLIVIENRTGKIQRQVNPTEKELEAEAKTVIEVGTAQIAIQILPGQSQPIRFSAPGLKNARIRCLCGTAPYIIHVFPR